MKPFARRPRLESEEERKHSKLAKGYGWFVDKIMRTARNGFPDRFYANANYRHRCNYCGRGRIVLMEWKRNGNGPSALQKIRIAELKYAGIEVYVVNSVAEANRILGIGHEDEEL